MKRVYKDNISIDSSSGKNFYAKKGIEKVKIDVDAHGILCGDSDKSKIEEWTNFEFQRSFRFLIWEIEFFIEREENIKQLLLLLYNHNIDENYIIDVIKKNSIHKDQIFNLIATKCFEAKLYDYVLPFLTEALKINNKDLDIIYNLGYVLHYFGEDKLALKYLKPIINKNNEIDNLINDVQNTLYSKNN